MQPLLRLITSQPYQQQQQQQQQHPARLLHIGRSSSEANSFAYASVSR
jgi:hypothetical protein